MKRPDHIPDDISNLRIVDEQTILNPGGFDENTNALLHSRRLRCNFNKLAEAVIREMYDGMPRQIRFSSDRQSIKHFAKRDISDFRAFALKHDDPEIRGAGLSILRDWDKALKHSWWNSSLLFEWGQKNAAQKPHFDPGRGIDGRVLCCYTDPATRLYRNEDVENAEEVLKWGKDPVIKSDAVPVQFRAGDMAKLLGHHSGWYEGDPLNDFKAFPAAHEGPFRENPGALLICDKGY